MNDGLFQFDDAAPGSAAPTAPMSATQREAIRRLFAELGVSDAAGQFAIVEELTGTRIRSVADLTEPTAQTLIRMLPGKLARAERPQTGNPWDDRDEPTWIDRL